MDDFAGTWTLVAAAFSRGEPLPADPRANRLGVATYLLGESEDDPGPASGLTLSIDARGRLSQTEDGTFAGYVYDAEGVETTEGGAFSGSLQPIGSRAFLLADRTRSRGTGRWLEPLIIRYDDGDTIVCDWVERDGGDLVRTISVVTDQMYPSRATLRYRLGDG